MENIQDYIESGILEQYVLGELSATDQAAVEAQAARHPEIQTELEQVQLALGFYAEAHAITPPAGMRERVLGKVMAQIALPSPSSTLRADVDAMAQAGRTPGVRSIASAPEMVAAPRSPWAIAASVALILSLGANALLYTQWQSANSDLVAMQNDQARYATTTQVVEKQRDELRQENQVLRSDDYRAVALAGTKDAPTAQARVLYSATSHKVYVDVKSLPKLPAGKQYQLWALDNGKPVDAGMLTATTATGETLQQMKDISSAQAFAVTIEPTGGSASPTMPIQAMGAVAKSS